MTDLSDDGVKALVVVSPAVRAPHGLVAVHRAVVFHLRAHTKKKKKKRQKKHQSSQGKGDQHGFYWFALKSFHSFSENIWGKKQPCT